MIKTLIEVFEELKRRGVEDPLADTLLLADLLAGGSLRGADRGALERRGLDPVSIAEQRLAGVPLEYIVGEAPFLGRMLACRPGALIPREETELLTLTCLGFIEQMQGEGRGALKVLELGTGSGNIAVLLALRTGDVEIYASDISEEAVEIARENIERCGVGDRVTLMCGDLYEPLAGLGLESAVDLVVCNPPYIPSSSVDRLDPSIRDNEPRVALDAGAYGIDIFRRLIKGAPDYLRSGGRIAFEIGAGQDRIVRRLFVKSDGAFGDLDCVENLEGVVRVMSAVRA